MKLGSAKPKIGKDSTRIEDLLDMQQFPKKKWLQVRILPRDILPVKMHWINIIAGKDRREVNIPKVCVAFDPATEADKKGKACPYCELAGKRDQQFYLVNVIVRSLQEDKPSKAAKATKEEKASGYKDKDSESWTPVRVLRVTGSLMQKLQELGELNKVKNKKTGKAEAFDVTDEKYGIDVNIKFDPDKSGTDMYSVQGGDRTPLTEEEQAYLCYELSEEILDKIGRETPAEAKKEVARMEVVGGDEKDEDEDEDEVKVGGKKSKSKSKHQNEDDEDDEDERPARGKSKKPAAKPAAKKPAAKKPVAKGKKHF